MNQILIKDLKLKKKKEFQLLSYLAYLNGNIISIQTITLIANSIMKKNKNDLQTILDYLEKASKLTMTAPDYYSMTENLQTETKKCLNSKEEESIKIQLIETICSQDSFKTENETEILNHLLDLNKSEIKNSLNKAMLINKIGVMNEKLGNFQIALDNFEIALRIYLDSELNVREGICYNNIGTVSNYLGNYEKALDYHERGLQTLKKFLPEKSLDISTTYNNIGLVHSKLGDQKKALEYYEKSLEIDIEILPEKHSKKATSFNNIGLACYNQGEH